jgi:tetratricopeptide (TPR) repeat protein
MTLDIMDQGLLISRLRIGTEMHTFIHYADKDQDLVRRIYADLYQAGVLPWARVFDVPPSANKDDAEFAALEQASALVAIFSKAYSRTPELLEFAEAGNALGLTVIPVVIEMGVEVPDHLPKPVKMVKRYAEAIADIAAQVEERIEGQAIPAWQRGNAAYYAGDYEAAMQAFESIKDSDLTPDALHSRAATYNAVRKYQEALADMDKALAADSSKAYYFRNRSLAYAGLEEFEKALADDEQALAIEPDSLESLSSHAMTLVALKRFDEAKSVLEKVIALAPDASLYQYQMGFAMQKAGDLEAALAAFDAVLEDDADNEGATIGRRVVLGRLGRHEEALAEVDRAIRKQPRKMGHYLTRSLINFYLERYEEAVKDANTALRGGQKDITLPATFNRAISLWRAGHQDEARADWEAVIELLPDLNSEKGIRAHAESELTAEAALEIWASLQEAVASPAEG